MSETTNIFFELSKITEESECLRLLNRAGISLTLSETIEMMAKITDKRFGTAKTSSKYLEIPKITVNGKNIPAISIKSELVRSLGEALINIANKNKL